MNRSIGRKTAVLALAWLAAPALETTTTGVVTAVAITVERGH